MASSSSELTLDCKPYNYSILLKSFGDQTAAAAADHHTQKLEDVLARLEDERLKVDAFKRELPLCMQLLSNAVEASRQQLQACRENENRGPSPVLEEFITLKNSSSENSDMSENMSDKSSWMTTAQLWSQPGNETKPQTNKTTSSYKESDVGFRNGGGGAFLPFSKERNSCRRSPTFRPLSDLAPASTDKVVMEDKKCSEINENGRDGNPTDEGQTNSSTTTTTNANQNHRKARRCWSPELHRRFVSALQILGGCHVATPKQIREMMKVDGLTNDEVKSHLQKYRLHTRRPSPSQQAIGASAPQLVVLGGIWVPQEYATAAAAAHGGTPTLYHHNHHPSSHALPPHFCAASSVPQDFYTAAAPPAQHQLHHHTLHNHRQLQVYKTTSQSQSSPESEIRGEGDRSESIDEDGKSESSSRKGESGGERKGLAALREDGEEESNGSEITLKF